MQCPEDVLEYWLGKIGPDGWYSSAEEIEAEVSHRFERTYVIGCEGALSPWVTYAAGALAAHCEILLDQAFRSN